MVVARLTWGIAAFATAALAVPLSVGALAVSAAPSFAGDAAADGDSAGTAVIGAVKPPPPVIKQDPPTIVTPPAPVGDRGPTVVERPAVAGSTTLPNGCIGMPAGSTGSAPGKISPLGVKGTTTADLALFAQAYNAKRVQNCLKPIPMANFRYDACMETRLFWMAEDPSTDPTSAWGHIGSKRSDGVPSVGCDGNLAGGMNNTGETVARKWWDSTGHRTALYRPSYKGSTASVCIYFAMTHGGIPNEPEAFTRAAARWGSC